MGEERKPLWAQAGRDPGGPYSVLFSHCMLELKAETLAEAKEMRCPKCGEAPLRIKAHA